MRLDDLVQEYKGKINIEIAKRIISDHYDVYLKKENPCSRTVCSHYDLDPREYMSDPSRPKPFAPRGALDGIVCDSDLANKMSFVARFGNSCGMPFSAADFCNKNRQWKYLEPYLKDRPTEPWTEFVISSALTRKTRKTRKIPKTRTTRKTRKTPTI